VAARREGCYNGGMSAAVTPVPIRTFVAIELPAPVLEALAGVQQALARLPLRLAGPAGLHLTLAFIGEIPAARVPEVVAAVQQGCAGVAPFALRAEGLGMFPNARAPRVIWAGVQGDPAAMTALTGMRERIVQQLTALGLQIDRRFDPHLTLARVGDRVSPADRAQIGATAQALPPLQPVTFTITRVAIMRSDLRPGGAMYTPLALVALTAPAESGA
jgi:RNA 2',3'-cyclic 3'-phosphodiesterase